MIVISGDVTNAAAAVAQAAIAQTQQVKQIQKQVGVKKVPVYQLQDYQTSARFLSFYHSKKCPTNLSARRNAKADCSTNTAPTKIG